MASAAQLASNRANAQRSTGPSTPAGKAVSRFNALKSGIDAESMVIPGEDPAELDNLKANYHLQFEPITPVEQFLVDNLTRADWLLRRYHRLEAPFQSRDCPRRTSSRRPPHSRAAPHRCRRAVLLPFAQGTRAANREPLRNRRSAC